MKIKSKLVYIPETVIDRLDYDILHYAKKIVFPHDVYTFTKEELINLVEDYTNKIIESISKDEYINVSGEILIKKEKITNQLNLFKINFNNERNNNTE